MTSASLGKALARGLAMKCPRCAEAPLFDRYLKVTDRCRACGEEMFHHQADDYPAYLVIFIVGKLLFAAVLAVELTYHPPTWVHLSIWIPLVVAGVLALLQPVKGAVVALQWKLGLHGFENSRQRPLEAK